MRVDVTLSVGEVGNRTRQRASQAAGLAAVIIAAVVLIGGGAGLPLLSSWGAGFPPMRPSAALCIAALGLALMHPGKDLRFAFAVGLAVVAVAAVGLGLILFDIDPGIDPWLAPRFVGPEPGAVSFRVAKVAALALGFAGGALALSRFARHRLAATMLSGIAGAFAVFALFGYVTGIDMLFGAYAGYGVGEAQLRDVREDLTIEARTLSANVDREVIGEIERLQALATSPSLRHGDFADFQHQAQASLAMRRSGNIVLIDRNMQQLVNTAVPFGKPLPKAGAPEATRRALATGQPQASDLFWAPVTKRLLVTIIVPVEIEGERRYALARTPEQRTFARLVTAKELPAGWQAVISDATHRIIAQSGDQSWFIGQELPPALWHRARTGGVFEFTDSESRPSLQASARSELTGWETAVWAPKALLEAPVRAQWRTLGVMAVLAIALVAASALWLGQIIARSVGHAARAALAAAEGGPLLPSGTPVAEVNTLMAELRETTDLLRESKDRLQLALNAAQLGSWQYDPFTRMVTGDVRCQEIFDVAKNEAAIEELLKPVHPDDAERLWTAIAASLDPVDPKRSATEFRLRRRNGEVRWVETLGLGHFEGAGRERRAVSMAGTAQDITERKEREEKEHLLMREINHRAKNMLSVVDSIAHQTATRNPEDFVERFSERIQALSANQDLLVRNEWNGVEIADLVRAQLAHFADLIGSRIAMRGPKLRLNPASAQAIGLALHELATNAGKYGALSADAGRVDFRWGCDGDTLTMSWTERDGPPVSAPERRGFGTIVMKSMAERSLDGAVQLDYAPSGLTWRLTCPAANALEPREREQTSGEGENQTGKVNVQITA